MTAHIRFTWLRPGGWVRLGVVLALALMFATPMLWALGAFGDGDESLRRALIFLFGGLWFGIGLGYGASWALHGFVLRSREDDEDERMPSPPRPAAAAPHPPTRR